MRAVEKSRIVRVRMTESDVLCLWAACVLREPEPLTRLLKKILRPAARILAKKRTRK